LKILEAMASSLPVVTTSVGAEGLGLEDGKQAIIKNDYEDLVESAIEVLKDKKLAKRLGVSGKKFVQENYTWQKSAELLDNIYKELVYDTKT